MLDFSEKLFTIRYDKKFVTGNLKGITVPVVIHNCSEHRSIRLAGRDVCTGSRYSVAGQVVRELQSDIWVP